MAQTQILMLLPDAFSEHAYNAAKCDCGAVGRSGLPSDPAGGAYSSLSLSLSLSDPWLVLSEPRRTEGGENKMAPMGRKGKGGEKQGRRGRGGKLE